MKQYPRCEHCGHVLAAPPHSRRLSPRQAELLAFIRTHIAEHDAAPSYAEMKRALGVSSPAHIHELLMALERKQYISVTPRARRAIALIPQPSQP